MIVPAFEEAFYISTQIERLSQSTKVFASPFRTLARLHDKGAFERLVTQLGLPIPETVVVTSDDELREATDSLERYFARGVFSRGGVCCLTNAGPLAGALDMEEVHPSPASPWLVQPFLDGETARGVVNPSAETFAAFERRQPVPQGLARGTVLATRQRAHEPFWRGG